MDYSELLKNYFYTIGNCTEVNVTRQGEGLYLAGISYVDEEIENYLGDGFDIVLHLDNVCLSDDSTAVCFIPGLVRLTIPNLDIIKDDFSNPGRACSILEEVAGAAKRFLQGIDLETENWIDID